MTTTTTTTQKSPAESLHTSSITSKGHSFKTTMEVFGAIIGTYTVAITYKFVRNGGRCKVRELFDFQQSSFTCFVA